MWPHFLGCRKVGRNRFGDRRVKELHVSLLNEKCILDIKETVACVSLDLMGKFGAGENGTQEAWNPLESGDGRVEGRVHNFCLISWI